MKENNNLEKEKCYTVYMHTSPSGKRYIGITSMTIEKRWLNGKGYQNQMFYRAIQKYGWNNFKHEILFENLTKKEAEQKERDLISYYKSNQSKYGYNIENGGSSTGKMSEETKRKIKKRKVPVNLKKKKKLRKKLKKKLKKVLKNLSKSLKRRRKNPVECSHSSPRKPLRKRILKIFWMNYSCHFLKVM